MVMTAPTTTWQTSKVNDGLIASPKFTGKLPELQNTTPAHFWNRPPTTRRIS